MAVVHSLACLMLALKQREEVKKRRKAVGTRVRHGRSAQPSMPDASTAAAGEGNGVEGVEASQVEAVGIKVRHGRSAQPSMPDAGTEAAGVGSRGCSWWCRAGAPPAGEARGRQGHSAQTSMPNAGTEVAVGGAEASQVE
eukprot:gene12486-15697_t